VSVTVDAALVLPDSIMICIPFPDGLVPSVRRSEWVPSKRSPAPCTARTIKAPLRRGTKSASRFEELDGISVRILDLDLPTTRTGFHLVAKLKSGLLQFRDQIWQIGDLQDDPIPAARLLRFTVRHRPRA